jgi:hypothetical protein
MIIFGSTWPAGVAVRRGQGGGHQAGHGRETQRVAGLETVPDQYLAERAREERAREDGAAPDQRELPGRKLAGPLAGQSLAFLAPHVTQHVALLWLIIVHRSLALRHAAHGTR